MRLRVPVKLLQGFPKGFVLAFIRVLPKLLRGFLMFFWFYVWDIFSWVVTVIEALYKVYIPYRSLVEALYTPNSPPVVSFNYEFGPGFRVSLGPAPLEASWALNRTP